MNMHKIAPFLFAASITCASADVYVPYGTSGFRMDPEVRVPAVSKTGDSKCAYVPCIGSEMGRKQVGVFTGRVGMGYDSKYVSRSLAVQDSASSDNAVYFEGCGQYTLSSKDALVGALRFDWLAGKGIDHYNSRHPLCDEGSALLEWAHYSSPQSVWAIGYQFVHGGLPGRLNYHISGSRQEFPFFDSHRPEEHSFVFDWHHDFSKGGEGFFWDTRVQYSFRWVSGWWFHNTLGYRYTLSEHTSLVATATWTASMNYFNRHTANSNGTQGYELSLSLPYKVGRSVTVTPYISTVFIGNGAQAANSRQHDMYRDFTFVAGAGVQYSF